MINSSDSNLIIVKKISFLVALVILLLPSAQLSDGIFFVFRLTLMNTLIVASALCFHRRLRKLFRHSFLCFYFILQFYFVRRMNRGFDYGRIIRSTIRRFMLRALKINRKRWKNGINDPSLMFCSVLFLLSDESKSLWICRFTW